MKKGIIFDLDGTLWDSSKQLIPAWNRVLKKYGQHTITDAELAGYMGKTQETIAALMMPDLPFEKAMEIFSECCKEEQLDLEQGGGIVYEDMEKTLAELNKDHTLYIVSNCHNEYMDAFFTAHKLKKYFADWECHGNTGLSKAANITLIIKRNSLDKAIYVGDTELDGLSAKEANIPFILAAYGFGSYHEADAEINNITELPLAADNIFNKENTMTGHGDKAEALFREGYNCAQSILCAFEDVTGLHRETAAKLASSFGGGLGRMREVCGAVSGAAMVLGLVKGYSDPKNSEAKKAHYHLIQEFCKKFKEKNGSIVCRELLSGVKTAIGNNPEERTVDYYKKRPCPQIVKEAAEIVEALIFCLE